MFVSWNAIPRSRAYLASGRIGVAENFRRHEADHAGDAIAVGLELGEIEVPIALEIHRHAVDHRLEMRLRQGKRGNDRLQGQRDRMLGPPAKIGVHLLAPPRKLRMRNAGVARFVDNVVYLAAERSRAR
jgi:hypothetical protein